jgi:hypothetical protein
MATTVDSRREMVSLIGSDKVESTPVYGGDDQKIGTVQRVMIDKVTGKVAYAVISFGGFLGMGEDFAKTTIPCHGQALGTTPTSVAIASASRKINSRALQSTIETLSGIGLTAAGTRLSTIIIVRRCGTRELPKS